ncbi:hypothetical protein EYF80_006141 [Liparis tanakae]|uniref:Uncharacterized protein n=1 Tax=Liparis tanakae TaxID=230148 RepID=A0A4Z2J2B9_9TELE|nr:hypothetical protein EYF80_006141 [Liparis tanakae]
MQFHPKIGRTPKNPANAQLAPISANIRPRFAPWYGLMVTIVTWRSIAMASRLIMEAARVMKTPPSLTNHSNGVSFKVLAPDMMMLIRESQVAQQVIHGQVELLVPPNGDENHSVLQDDEETHHQEGNALRLESFAVAVFLQLAGVVVVLHQDRVVLVLPVELQVAGSRGNGGAREVKRIRFTWFIEQRWRPYSQSPTVGSSACFDTLRRLTCRRSSACFLAPDNARRASEGGMSRGTTSEEKFRRGEKEQEKHKPFRPLESQMCGATSKGLKKGLGEMSKALHSIRQERKRRKRTAERDTTFLSLVSKVNSQRSTLSTLSVTGQTADWNPDTTSRPPAKTNTALLAAVQFSVQRVNKSLPEVFWGLKEG